MITLLAPTIDAAADVLADATRYQFVTISADALAAAETAEVVDIEVVSGSTPVVVADPATGTARQLTVDVPALQLAGGVVYRLSKNATQGACGLYMHPCPGTQS